jgi:serine/threonine protein kinase
MSDRLAGLPEYIGRYQLVDVLGVGGMGRVVRGHDPVLKRDVAIKLVEPQAVAPEDLGELRFMFHREARATAGLRHPNIIEVFDYSGPHADLMYLVCELIDGETLRNVLEARVMLSAIQVAALGFELAQALAHAHERGIVHRDIKPENIFWTKSGRVVLADFGIAKAFANGPQLGGTVVFGATHLYGSPAYMAPEQLTGDEVGPETDLYALGTVLAEAWLGQALFSGCSVADILDAVKAGQRAHFDSTWQPASLARLIETMLSTAPRDRPRRASVVAATLRQVLDSLKISDPRLYLRDQGAQTDQLQKSKQTEQTEQTNQTAATLLSAGQAQATEIIQASTANGLAPAKGQSGLRWALVAGLVVALAASGALVLRLSGARHLPPTVMVTIRWSGRATVFLDGREVGIFVDGARLGVVPGGHRMEVRTREQTQARDVLVLVGTQPEYDFGDGS